ncbi:zinc finger protein CONSTANS-LIKE 2-like [Cucurbita moschata]|uniref:Zinc finger protein CONSTANS-LIKE 2-like n=1 Tax=Cucurbita moschata TaxID=3662 RepID=A0A6J1GAY3_CUCMO|nr:zinc finger protein CONSTANS-LIKE 2-like [Cucurbita moschata]
MLKTEDDYFGGAAATATATTAVICEACERSPAVFICKADAASLCAACDAEIHSANPLARRHHRVPIGGADMVGTTPECQEDEDEDEAASWLLLNPLKTNNENRGGGSIQSNNNTNGLFLLGGEDDYLNFVEFNGCGEDQFEGSENYGGGGGGGGEDRVVPIEFEGKDPMLEQSYGGVDGSYSYNGFLTHAVTSLPTSLLPSSMEVGVVPDSATTMSDISVFSNIRPPKGTIDLFSGAADVAAVQMPATQLCPMDREARVLRYREKKKTRKFEKTIRYASRKAYAETRPRIKGRFAKRTDVEVKLDRKFSSPLMANVGYGIVPSF